MRKQRRLAGAGRTKQRQQLAWANVERDIANGEALAVALHHILDLHLDRLLPFRGLPRGSAVLRCVRVVERHLVSPQFMRRRRHARMARLAREKPCAIPKAQEGVGVPTSDTGRVRSLTPIPYRLNRDYQVITVQVGSLRALWAAGGAFSAISGRVDDLRRQ